MLAIYVKATSNYPEGHPFTSFEELGPTWTGESVSIPFGDPGSGDFGPLTVVGWTDLFSGRPCPVHVARVRNEQGGVGFLVWGGNSGVRILNDEAPVEEWNAHLPQGYGRPFIWVEDENDLPAEVRQVVTAGKEE